MYLNTTNQITILPLNCTLESALATRPLISNYESSSKAIAYSHREALYNNYLIITDQAASYKLRQPYHLVFPQAYIITKGHNFICK